MKYYQFHLGDYAQHTGHLDPIEDIVYRRMLDLYYREQSPLPTDVHRIAKLIRMPEHASTVRDILNEFFTESPEGHRNTRADREIDSYKRMADGGAKGAAKRWLKRGDAHPMATPCPPDQNPNANHEPITINQEPIITAPQSDAKKRGSRLADDWVLPKHWGEWALSQFPNWSVQEIRTESEKFRDFWVAKSGKDAAKLDWEATWRNWCRNAKKSSDVTRSETPYARQMRERVAEAAGSLAHIVAAKPPGQTYLQPKTPWEIAIENKRQATAIGMGGCDLLETVDQVREGLPLEIRGSGLVSGEG